MAQTEKAISFLIGYKKAGKSTLHNFLIGNPFEISYNSVSNSYDILSPKSYLGIGNDDKLSVYEAISVDNFYEMPGLLKIYDNPDKKAFEFYSIYKALLKYQKIRLVLVFDYEMMLCENGSEFLVFLDKVSELYRLDQRHLKGIHIVITKFPSDCFDNFIEFIQYIGTNYPNPIISGLLNCQITHSFFNNPDMLYQSYFSFSDATRSKILSKISQCEILTTEDFDMDFYETFLYSYINTPPSGIYRIDFLASCCSSKDFENNNGLIFNKELVILDENIDFKNKENIKIFCNTMIVKKRPDNQDIIIKIPAESVFQMREEMIIANSEKLCVEIEDYKSTSDYWKDAKISITEILFTNSQLKTFPVKVFLFWPNPTMVFIPPHIRKKINLHTFLSYNPKNGYLACSDFLSKCSNDLMELVRKDSTTNDSTLEFKIEIISIHKEGFERKDSIEVVEHFVYSKVLFISELPKKIVCSGRCFIKADYAVVIDENLEIESHVVTIDCPCIILIKGPNDGLRRFTIIGDDQSTLIFSPNIHQFINSQYLFVKFTEKHPSFYHYFPPYTQRIFKANPHYLRIEHILINSFIKEYLSYNNKFLELIVYWDNNFGKIFISDKWPIEKSTTIIYSKFYINEKMNFKSLIKNKYKAVRDFESVEKYLEKLGIVHDNDLIKQIEEVLSCIPSIFHMLMVPDCYKVNTDCTTLNNIKKMLIKKYVNMIKNSDKSDGISLSVKYLNRFDFFLQAVGTEIKDKHITKKVFQYLNNGKKFSDPGFMNDCADFLCVFEKLNKSFEGRSKLIQYHISGDKSEYAPWSLENGKIVLSGFGFSSARIVLKDIMKSGLKRVAVRIVVSGISEGVRQTAKMTLQNSIRQAASLSVRGANTVITVGVAATLFGVELGANYAVMKHNSKYVGGVIYLV